MTLVLSLKCEALECEALALRTSVLDPLVLHGLDLDTVANGMSGKSECMRTERRRTTEVDDFIERLNIDK